LPKDNQPHNVELWIDGAKFQGQIHSMSMSVDMPHMPFVDTYVPWADQFKFWGNRYGHLDVTFDIPAEVTYDGMVDAFLSRLQR
jgi:hypothetical protein